MISIPEYPLVLLCVFFLAGCIWSVEKVILEVPRERPSFWWGGVYGWVEQPNTPWCFSSFQASGIRNLFWAENSTDALHSESGNDWKTDHLQSRPLAERGKPGEPLLSMQDVKTARFHLQGYKWGSGLVLL